MTLTAVCTLAAAFPSIGATTPNAAYLTGTWEVNTDGACGKKDAEQLTLNKDATFDYGRHGKVEAVGFWRVERDLVVFDMLTSPAYFQDIANELKEHTYHETYTMRMMPLDIQQDRFDAVAVIDDQMSKLALQRCR